MTTTKQWKIRLLDESRLIWAAIFTCTKIVSARGVYWMMGPALSSGLLACAHQWACNCPASTRAPSLSKINKISCLHWKENKRLNMVWWEKNISCLRALGWSINKWDRFPAMWWTRDEEAAEAEIKSRLSENLELASCIRTRDKKVQGSWSQHSKDIWGQEVLWGCDALDATVAASWPGWGWQAGESPPQTLLLLLLFRWESLSDVVVVVV